LSRNVTFLGGLSLYAQYTQVLLVHGCLSWP
jgi:hypothetical protein